MKFAPFATVVRSAELMTTMTIRDPGHRQLLSPRPTIVTSRICLLVRKELRNELRRVEHTTELRHRRKVSRLTSDGATTFTLSRRPLKANLPEFMRHFNIAYTVST